MGKQLIVVETLFEYIGEIDESVLDEKKMPKTPFVLKNCFRMHQMMDGAAAVQLLVGPYGGMKIRSYMVCRPPEENEVKAYEKNIETDAARRKTAASGIIQVPRLPPGMPMPPGQ